MMSEEGQADALAAVPENRLLAWTVLMVFSAITIGAHISWDDNDEDSGEKYLTAAACLSMIFAFFAVVAHFAVGGAFVGTPVEGGIGFLLLIFWVAALPIIMNPYNAIAVSIAEVDDVRVFTILNANLYFFSWGAFLSNVYIIGHHAKYYGANITKTPPNTVSWFGLTMCSIVVLGASTKYLNEFCDDNNMTSDCRRTKYGIALGATGFFFGALMTIMCKCAIEQLYELVVSAILFVMYIFGAGYLTFGGGPGTFVGNLYFFTWIGFMITLFLTQNLLAEVRAGRKMATDSNTAPAPSMEDVVVEELDNI